MNDQTRILNFLHNSVTAKLSLINKGVSPIIINQFWLNLLKVVRSNQYQAHIGLGPIIYAIKTDFFEDKKTDNLLDPAKLETLLKTGISKKRNVFHVDYNGEKISVNPFESVKLNNIEEVSDFSENKDELFVFIKGVEVTIFYKAKIIKNIPDVFTINSVGQIKASLPISEYTKLLGKHYDEEIVGERGLKYWQNKAKRELIAAPEEKFRKKLANFLTNNVSDGFIDEECLNDNSNDRNDIRIVTLPDNNVYIIEIKWIGKSDGANYDGIVAHQKANEGLEQLHLYIDGESRCIQGILLIYDARKDMEEIKWNKKIEEWNANIDQPITLLELDPISSSDKAKLIVKNSK